MGEVGRIEVKRKRIYPFIMNGKDMPPEPNKKQKQKDSNLLRSHGGGWVQRAEEPFWPPLYSRPSLCWNL